MTNYNLNQKFIILNFIYYSINSYGVDNCRNFRFNVCRYAGFSLRWNGSTCNQHSGSEESISTLTTKIRVRSSWISGARYARVERLRVKIAPNFLIRSQIYFQIFEEWSSRFLMDYLARLPVFSCSSNFCIKKIYRFSQFSLATLSWHYFVWSGEW